MIIFDNENLHLMEALLYFALSSQAMVRRGQVVGVLTQKNENEKDRIYESFGIAVCRHGCIGV